MLTTFECSQCGMPFVFKTNDIEAGFAAVDHDLWLETCLDNDVDRSCSPDANGAQNDCPSKTCVYAQEAAACLKKS